MSMVLVIAAHPDDEVLGCGGAMARHADAGDRVHVVFLADGVTARQDVPDLDALADALRRREDGATAAARILGAEPPVFHRLPDNRLDGVPLIDLAKLVEREIARIGPDIVYTHHGGDLNVDHRLTHQAVLTACRPLPGARVRVIYAFEVLSGTEWGGVATGGGFTPTRFVDIASQLQRKLDALACYDDEMRPFPHPRSKPAIEALVRLRGSASGLTAAEAFCVVREIV